MNNFGLGFIVMFCGLTVTIAVLVVLFISSKQKKTNLSIEYLLDQILNESTNIIMPLYLENINSKLAHRTQKVIDYINIERSENRVEKEKLQSLLSDISHQIKTPMTNISLYNSLLQEQLSSDFEGRKYVNNISEQVEKLQWLLEQLIKTARLESGVITVNPRITTIKETIALAIETVWEKAEQKNISIKLTSFPQYLIYHDPKWTAEALANILDNAIKYSPKNSEIILDLKRFELFSEISVIDQGIGVSPDEYNNLFKRFYRSQVNLDQPGVGLGLYISQYITNCQGGYITVKNRNPEGKGTIFTLFLKNSN